LSPIEQRRRDVAALADGKPLAPDQLQRIADGPIMDPNRLYLPAGKLTEQEWRAREAANRL
jgi:hypothetical protein